MQFASGVVKVVFFGGELVLGVFEVFFGLVELFFDGLECFGFLEEGGLFLGELLGEVKMMRSRSWISCWSS